MPLRARNHWLCAAPSWPAFAASVLAGVCLVLAACTKIDDGSGHSAAKGAAGSAASKNSTTIAHTLRIGDNADVTTLNPHLAASSELSFLSEMTMAWLVRYDRNERPVPELATQVPSKQNHLVSRDGLTITWRLRKGVKWSDGAPFDGDDVVFSTNVVNNTANNEVGRDGWDFITKIDEPDKYTVVFHLNKPFSGFLPAFFGSAGANPCILPKHLLYKLANINNAPYNSLPVGIGPFRYVRWSRGDSVELAANPNYWRGVPKLKKIVYKFIPDRNTLLTQLKTGEIDLWPLVGLGYYNQIKALPNDTTIHWPGDYYAHLDFNLTRPLFEDKAVREALRFALDRRTIRDKVQHGLGVLQETPITPKSPLYTALPSIPFDLARANALLDADGWKRGADGVRSKDGKRLAFNLVTQSGTADTDQGIELMRDTWRQIGVQLSVLHYPYAVLFGPPQQGGIVFGGKYDAAFFSWQMTPDEDLSGERQCALVPPDGENTEHYCDRATDALLFKAKAAYGVDERRPILAAVERRVVADVPEVVMWIREDIYSYNNDLTGWHPNPATPFDDMLDVDI